MLNSDNVYSNNDKPLFIKIALYTIKTKFNLFQFCSKKTKPTSKSFTIGHLNRGDAATFIWPWNFFSQPYIYFRCVLRRSTKRTFEVAFILFVLRIILVLQLTDYCSIIVKITKHLLIKLTTVF